MMSFKKVLFVSVFVLVILLCYSPAIPDVDAIATLPQKGVKIVNLSMDQQKIVSKANKISSLARDSLTPIEKEERIDLSHPGKEIQDGIPHGVKTSSFPDMKKRNTAEENNFFGLDKYLSRDGLTLTFPINHSLRLETSLSPVGLNRCTKLHLHHKNRLAIFNSEVTIGFAGDYDLRFGLIKYF